MSTYFFIVGTGSAGREVGGPFVFVSLGEGGQLVQKHDFLPLDFICLST